MEKTMSVEEKIRRAEEIYNRRNMNNNTYRYNSKEKKKNSLIKRMIRQIIICFIIYGVFYIVSNRDYYFSKDFQSKVEHFVSQSETLEKGYFWVKGYWNKYFNKDSLSEQEQSTNKTNTQSVESEEEQQLNTENNLSSLESNDENIGGSVEETLDNNQKTQEEKDVEQIKNTISFIVPVDGTISSTFGWRTPTTATVPKYHTGLDIATSKGTVIKSATDGKVILVSSEGDYGKHYKIQINDVVIIYAHCSKLYLTEGEEVKQGQNIAEVGSTGNSTRTTFTF